MSWPNFPMARSSSIAVRGYGAATSMTGWSIHFTSWRPKPSSAQAGVVVQALHLTDGTAEPVTLSGTKLGNRRGQSETMLAGIAAGDFPVEIDAAPVALFRTVPPLHLPATPVGDLNLT